MAAEYFNDCIEVLTSYLIAEVITRLYKLATEYICYKHHYNDKEVFLEISKRAFSLNDQTKVLVTVDVVSLILRAWSTNELISVKSLKYIPIFLLISAVGLSKSSLDYSNFIRENHSLDYAGGMAANYFFGYLKLALPASQTREVNGIRERIELYSSTHGVTFAINRLVILIPSTMYVKPKIESDILEKVAPLEYVVKYRAGVERIFKNDVYRITKPINGQFYYVALEGATPLQSFYDAMHSEVITSTRPMKEMQREILLKFNKHLRKLLMSCPETENEVELVLYNVYDDNGKLEDVGEVLVSHIKYLWSSKKLI